MRLSYILARLAVRTGLALWRHEIALLLATVSVGALGVYELGYAVPTTSNRDCADTTMAAMTSGDDATAHAAYTCLGPSMRNTTEDAFVSGVHESAVPRGQVSRVGDQRTRDGGRIVFFTVEQQGQMVGYIVYLDPTGRVSRVE
jgi:hypothetical protein